MAGLSLLGRTGPIDKVDGMNRWGSDGDDRSSRLALLAHIDDFDLIKHHPARFGAARRDDLSRGLPWTRQREAFRRVPFELFNCEVSGT